NPKCEVRLSTVNPTPESPASPGLSSFSRNLDDVDFSGNSSQRPVKKAKLKKYIDKQMWSTLNNLKKNRQITDMLKKANLDRWKQLDIQRQNLARRERKEENNILFLDLEFYLNQNLREFFSS
ncbi:No apical meristem-associated, C-terminal domain containing protein, partial [Parasponia andersonii]